MDTERLAGSHEERALFNPALLAVLSFEAARAHKSESGFGLSASILYLLLPLTLHEHARKQLPRRASAQMLAWVQRQPLLVSSMPGWVEGLKPFVSSGLRLAMASGVLEVNQAGRILPGSIRTRRPRLDLGVEVEDCRKTARFLGRWFGRQPDLATVLSIWGFQP